MSRTISAFGLVLALVMTSGCASLMPGSGGATSSSGRRIPLRVVRDHIPADYDVLVGELAQIEGDFEAARAAFERAAVKDPDSSFVHDRLARLAWQLEDPETAILEAERAFELDPDSVRVRLFLGRLYRLSRDLEGLDRVLRDADGRPLDADSAYALFQAAAERRDLAEAEKLAHTLIEIEPDQLRGTLALTSIHEEKREYAQAESTVRDALVAFPDHFLLYMRLAQIKRVQGDRAGEIAVYREVLEGHPQHYGILQRLGQAQIEGNDLEGGIATYRQIVEAYPDDLNSLHRLAQLEFAAGRYEAAAGRLEAVLARGGGQPETPFALGQIRKAMGDIAGALAAFESVPSSAPIYADARIQIAAIYQSEERPEEALRELELARSVRPNRQLEFQIAALQAELGDFEGGVALLESLLDGSEADTEVYYQLGVQYGVKKDVDEALRYMQRVLEAEPNNPNALNYVGYSWAEQGENLEEAEALIRRALEAAPDDGYITDSLGWVYYKMAESLLSKARRDEAIEQPDRAQEHLLQAAELTGGDSVVLEHLGDVLLLRGDEHGALDYYEEAAETDIREDEQPHLLEKRDRLRGDLGRGSKTSSAP